MKWLSTLWEAVMKQDAFRLGLTDLPPLIKDLLQAGIDFGHFTNHRGYKHLPNVKTFKVQIRGGYDPILKEHHLLKREFPPLLHSTPYRNKRLNRYVDYQFSRLEANLTNPKLFWIIADTLLHKSVSYQTMMFYAVYPNWHRNMPYLKVLKILRTMRSLDKSNYLYKIVHIPKGNGETRPLGVPTPSWRVYLHGLNNILLCWLSPYIPTSQHGYIPKRGTTTAWKEIMNKVIDSPNIMEFDLSKFFDSVNLDVLGDLLLRTGIPLKLVIQLLHWNRTLPQTGELNKTWSNGEELQQSQNYHQYRQYSKTLNYLQYRGNSPLYDGLINNQNVQLSQSNQDKEHYSYYYGVSQGSPTSPLLSTFVLIPYLLLNKDIVQYADDGILYSDAPINLNLEFPIETGIKQNLQKSHQIKVNGTWLTPLTYLGISYIPTELMPEERFDNSVTTKGGILLNWTRTNKDYMFEHFDGIDLAIRRDSSMTMSNSLSFEEWFNSKYAGFVISRLYLGKDLLEIMQDFTYRFEKWSWSDLNSHQEQQNNKSGRIDLDVFNSSSFASFSLARKIQATFPKVSTYFRYL